MRHMRRSDFRSIFICALVAAPTVLIAQVNQDPIATVEGQPIYDQDLLAVAGGQLIDLRNQEYRVKTEALETLIRARLLEAEAKKKGVSSDKLLKKEIDSKVHEPSDDEARAFYLAAQNQVTLPFEIVKPQVRQLLRNAEIQQARKEYEASLRAKADISILLQPPSVEVAYDAGRIKGNANAPVTIIEFADFQCPFCQRAEATLKALLDKYKGRVKLAYLDFPLTEIHGQAEIAAEAARCAGEQSKFWEYHDSLFADQSRLDEASLIGRARDLHLDEGAFRSCLVGGKFQQDIRANREQGTKAGVIGTPAFFINGVFLGGALPQAEFERIIDGRLMQPGGAAPSANGVPDRVWGR